MQSYEEKFKLPTEPIHFYGIFKKNPQKVLVIKKKAVPLHPQSRKQDS